MSFKHLLKMTVIAIAVITSTLLMTPSAIAEGNLSNQDLNQPAFLVAPDPKIEINIYPKPGEGQRRISHGESGDRVTIHEQVGSNEGFTWNYVTFDPGVKTLEGWVRSDFISFEAMPSQKVQNSNADQQRQSDFVNSGNRYLSNSKQNSAFGNSRPVQRQNSYRQQQNQQQNN